MNGRDFLDAVLGEPSDTELAVLLETLVSHHVPEDTWLDYKDGRWTQSVDVGELRKDVTAFGNADGGCLVVGIAEKDKRPTHFATCVGDLDRAAKQTNSVVGSLAGLLFPAPRAVRRVQVSSGEDLLVIAVPRSARMAHVTESGELRYFLRIADGTQRVPGYLLADLFFGRRQRPELAFRPVRGGVDQTRESGGCRVSVRFELENRGFSWAREVHAGAVFWTLPCDSHTPVDDGHALFGRLRWDAAATGTRRGYRAFQSGFAIPPFEPKFLTYWALLPSGTREWCSVVYAGTSEGPPQWWEIVCTLPPEGEQVDVEVREIWDRAPGAWLR